MSTQTQRLSHLASCAGCAAKAGAAQLADVLRYLSDRQSTPDPNLLVGLDAPDDAAVYKLNDEQAIVVSADFFAPLVDDPYAYGAIAAANALSDIYAMGGETILALNIAAFPADMPPDTIAEVLRGGADKVEEAGAVVAGGHTIIDAEPKYGLCAIGVVHPRQIFTKAGARPGDELYLTKALGTGLITTAAKFDETSAEVLSHAVDSMTALNRHAAHVARELGAHAMTDITGFGLLGHGYEIAAASDAALRFEASALPLLPGALDCAYRGTTTGGAIRNEDYLQDKVRIAPGVSAELRQVLYDPQTSGGLLFAVEPGRDALAAFGAPVWRVGTVVEGAGVDVVAGVA